MSITPVRFVTHHDIAPADAPGFAGGYEAGDVVGLPDTLAASLIGSRIAVAAPIAGSLVPPSTIPDPVAALASASAVIAGLGTAGANPQAAATLAAEAPAHFAAGKAAS